MDWSNRETRIVAEHLIVSQEARLSGYLEELDDAMRQSEILMTSDQTVTELSGIIRDDLTNGLDLLGDGLYPRILSYALFERVNYHEIAIWILARS